MNPEVQAIALEGIKKGIYKKNIHYFYRPDADIREFQVTKMLAGSPGMSAWVIQQAYRKIGVQMQVSKDVTADLLATDFSEAAKLEEVPWPAPVVEMYFEDPLLPTILLMKTHPRELEKLFPKLKMELEDTEYITALMQEGSTIEEGKQLSLQLKPSMYEAFLTAGVAPKMELGLYSHPLSDGDNCIISYMLYLALKVFIFSSIPQYKPISITRKQMTWGGKPDVKDRPARPAFKTAYLPKVVHIPVARKTGGEHEFRGRRGHLHWYRHERFVNRRGTWDFIQPVVDPHTGKYPQAGVIKVRKP